MSQYEAAPAGEIECEIVAASIAEVAWRKGQCLRLRLRPAGNYAFVFCDVPLDWGRMLEAVRAAAGVSSDLVPQEYIGARVRVSLKHYVAKDGTTRASVAKWLPAPMWPVGMAVPESPTLVDCIKAWEYEPTPAPVPAPPAKPEPKKATPAVVKQAATKPSRNAPPQYGADDDIPF